jgi:NhaA family Na+:H+ antiporter
MVTSSLSLGIIAGLISGKPLGISLFVWLAVKTRISVMPQGITMKKIIGTGFLGGIGFTMSIFISLLAFQQDQFVLLSKVSIILASLLSGIIGFAILRLQPYVNSEKLKS